MVRVLYISGLVFCAVLIGYSAHSLQKQYKAGTLFDDPYNNEGRSTIALFAASSIGLAALCLIEIGRIRRRSARSGFFSAMPDDGEPVAAGSDSTSIYDAPVTVDAWQGPRQPVLGKKKSRRRSLHFLFFQDRPGFWMSLLRIYSAVLPILYGFILFYYLFTWVPDGIGAWWLTTLFSLLMLGSVICSVGILRRKPWGRRVGFAVALFHLLIFPIGTLAGFVMLLALIGATSEFDVISRRRVGSGRKAKRGKSRAGVV